MPRKPRKPCRHPGCPELTEERCCKHHEKETCKQDERSQGSWKPLYKTARWQRLRKQILTANPLCVNCEKEGRLVKATVADHVIPHKGMEALFFDAANLQPLCKPCHDRKTAREDGRWKPRVYTY